MFNKFRIITLILCIVLIVGLFVLPSSATSTVLLAVEGPITDANLVKFKGINGIGEDTGLAASNVVKNNFVAVAGPTVNDDVDLDYTIGSRWLDVTNDKSYVCLDNADGAAVWHLDVVGPGISTDNAIVRWDSTTGRTVLNSVVIVSDAGVVAGGEWQGTVISPVYGGIGIANNVASTIAITGNYATTLTVTGLTGITLPEAGTLCITTGTPETAFQIDDDNTGPKLKNVAGEMQVRNAADDAYADFRALSFYGDGSNLTNVGAAASTALTISCKVNEVSGITKGQVVYYSGAVGQFPQVSLADNTIAGESDLVGVAAETKADGQTILIRVAGELINVDTSAFTDSDVLYLSTSGGMINTVPTSGTIIIVGGVEYAHASLGKIAVAVRRTIDKGAPANTNMITRLGDSAGITKEIWKDYANNEVAYVDSNGKADFNELILDTPLAVAEGGTNSGTALLNDRVMISNTGSIKEAAAITVTELGLLNGLTNSIVTNANPCTDIEGTGLSISTGTLNWSAPANSIDSDAYVDASIDHEHLHNDVIHGMTVATLAASDEYLFWDETAGALRKITWDNLMGSITKVGTVTTGIWQGTTIAADQGGTGVANNAASTITITGNYSLGLTLSGATALTLPTTGTVATLAGTEELTNKTLTIPVINFNVTTSTTTNVLTVAESGLILVSSTHTETLPTAVGNSGLIYIVKKTDANTDLVTIDANGTETIDGELTYTDLNYQYAYTILISDNANWQIIGESIIKGGAF